MEIDTLLVAKVLDQADLDFGPLGITRANHAHPAQWWQPHEQSRACTCEHCRLYVRLLDERRASEGQPASARGTADAYSNRTTECPPSSLKDLL